jgi:hypothetical protein
MKAIKEDRGMALIAAVMASFVALTLMATVLYVAAHNATQSAADRKRVQSVAAAEAGINWLFSYMQNVSPAAMVCTSSQTLPTTPLAASFQATATLYDSSGSAISCPPPAGVVPAAAEINSVGTVNGTVPRKMQAKVGLTPVYGSGGYAIYSNSDLVIVNQLTVNGYQSNDANLYTNGNLTMANNSHVFGSAFAQGNLTMSSAAAVNEDVWAHGAVAMSNTSHVFGDATSSVSSVALTNSARIDGNARAGTTITPSSPNVGGLVVENAPQSGPPPQTFPQITFDAAAWLNAGYTPQYFTDCGAAQGFIAGIASGNWAVRINAVCPMVYANNSTVNVRGNLAIITDGSFWTTNQVSFNGTGGTWNVFVIDVYRPGLDCASGNYNVGTSNNTSWNSMNIYLYSPCALFFGNNNSEGVNGQLIGDLVNVTNNFTMNYRPLTVPGTVITGFSEDIRYLREVRAS